MIIPRHTIKYKLENKSLVTPLLNRRFVLKKPPISIRFAKCENNINYIRNTIFISINSTRSTIQSIPNKKQSRPLSVEKIRPCHFDFKTPRLASNTGSRIKPRKREFQDRIDTDEENTEIYKVLYSS